MLKFSVPDSIPDRFTPWDYVAFGVMLLYSGALGVYCAFSGGPKNTIRQLLIGSGTLPVLPVSTSLMASFISAAYILGNAAEVYEYGTMVFMTFLSYCAMIPTAMLFYLPVFYKLGVTTAFEYIELRFGRITRVCAVVVYVIQMLIYVSISLYAPALAMSQVTGMDLWIAISAMGVVCTIYTSIGGIKAVVYTDTFQAVYMTGALIIVIVASVIRFEGVANVWNIALQGNRIEFGRVIFLNLPFLCVALFLSCFCGLLVYARYVACDPMSIQKVQSADQLLPYFVMDVLGYWTPLPGIFVAGIFAASLSSVSSGVNALASVFYVDVIAVIKEGIPDSTGAKIINLLGVAFGISSIGLVGITKQLGNVLEASQSVNSAIGGPLLGLFTAGMLFPQINTTGALWGLFVSLAASLWINIGAMIAGPSNIRLSTSLAGCPVNYTAVKEAIPTYLPYSIPESNVLWVYQLSQQWYSLVAFVLVFLVAMPISLVTGSLDGSQLDPRLIRHPADIFLWWMDDEERERWRFDVGENFEKGEVFEPGKSVSSFSGVRMSTSCPASRKSSFSSIEMRRRHNSVFMTPYLSDVTNPAVNDNLGSNRRQSRRSTRYSASSTRSKTRKPSFTDSEMMRRQSQVFMAAYMPPSTPPATKLPLTSTSTMSATISEHNVPPASSLRTGRPSGHYSFSYADEIPNEKTLSPLNSTISEAATSDTGHANTNINNNKYDGDNNDSYCGSNNDLYKHHIERF
ncbi:sodium-coupled monocarboxylate transporter 1-like isoform X2 [Varroa jacobsoni]|uniref:sodium-coupled monocarboxylate transporter 1-like isoform X2 n=1 Tax=Varroa jacobsoni TaxID=62625 RepID=UPI000BF9CC99|nr:sodium-coupled monocarboxylate transporter 1-like isoform X2 [Varroa jacobsoni]